MQECRRDAAFLIGGVRPPDLPGTPAWWRSGWCRPRSLRSCRWRWSLHTQRTGGVVGGGLDHIFLPDLPAQAVEHALVQVGGGAGDGAVGQLAHAVAQPCGLTAQIELSAVRQTGAAAGVGHEDHSAGEHGEAQPHRTRGSFCRGTWRSPAARRRGGCGCRRR